MPCACHSNINVFFHLSHFRVYIPVRPFVRCVIGIVSSSRSRFHFNVIVSCIQVPFICCSISGEIILWSLRLIAYLFCPYASLLFIKHPAMKWLVSRSFTVKKNNSLLLVDIEFDLYALCLDVAVMLPLLR